jgi:transposase
MGTPYKSDPEFHAWLDEYKPKLIPKAVFKKNNLLYELKACFPEWLPSMFYVCRQLELLGHTVQALPLRTSHVPRYITLDTSCLIELMYDTSGNALRKKDSFEISKPCVWMDLFAVDRKVFRFDRNNAYVFHYMIETDGVGVSILFHRKDRVDLADPNQYARRFRSKADNGIVAPPPELYVDQVDRATVQGMKVVGIDVGKMDLLHCTDGGNFYRYTANQRRAQTRTKKYMKLTDKKKHETSIDGKTVKEWESVLSQFNKNTSSFADFKSYVDNKIPIAHTLRPFYEEHLHRKLNWNTFINRQRSEANMVNLMQKKFGPPSNVVIAIGDYGQGSYHLRGKEPCKGKGFRKVLRRRGFKVYLVDEYKTSKTCYACKCPTETFHTRESHKPKDVINKETGEKKIIVVHGLLRCTSANECGRLWNRDVNGALNIRLLALAAFSGQVRPAAYRR